jgi:hypothetical protein
LWGEASSSRLPGIIPAGYVSQTGYQYDSISRVAGHRELAPPSKFSKLGGFNSNVFITSGILHPQPSHSKPENAETLLFYRRPNHQPHLRTRLAPPKTHFIVYLTSLHPPKTFLPMAQSYIK